MDGAHMTDLGQECEALRRAEDGPVKRPYLSLVRNRTTWSDLRLADGEQYTIGERVDAVELTPEIRAALAAREEPQGVNQWLELQIQLTESQLAGLPEDLPGKPMSPLRASLAGVAYGLKLALEYSRNGLATVTFTTSVLALPCGRVIGTEAPMPDGAVRCPCGQVHPRQGRAEIATPWMVAPNA